MMVSTRMTVGARLYMGFGMILAVMVVITGIALIKVDRIDEALRLNNEIHVQVQRYAINFRGSVHDRSIAVRDVVLAATPSERDAHIAEIEGLADFYAQSAAPLERLIRRPEADPSLGELYNTIRSIEARTVATTQEIIAQASAGRPVSRELLTQTRQLYVQWLDSINALIDFKEARIQSTNQLAMEEASSFLEAMLAALLVALLLGSTAAWVVSRSIVRQLGVEPEALAQVARQVAHGDLSTVVVGSNEAGGRSVLASLADMQRSLAGVVGMVRRASNAVTVSAREISIGNSGLLQRTEEQAFSLQQVRDSMLHVTKSIRNNADSARQAAQVAATASEAARGGGALVAEVVSTMDKLNTSSHEMSDIVGVIDSIAFQTNILALNAAVEAARAGTDGRGFAVVAGEVRALAQRSAAAAKEIGELIDQSVARVGRGAQLVGEAGSTMTEIVKQAEQVAALIAEISAATREQTQDIGVVNEAVAQLDGAIQQNAAMVEQSASAAQALRQQAQELAEAVSVFRLNVDTTVHAEPSHDPLSNERARAALAWS